MSIARSFGCRSPESQFGSRVAAFIYEETNVYKRVTIYGDGGESHVEYTDNLLDALQIYKGLLAKGWKPMSNEDIEVVVANDVVLAKPTLTYRWIIGIICVLIVCFIYYWFRLRHY